MFWFNTNYISKPDMYASNKVSASLYIRFSEVNMKIMVSDSIYQLHSITSQMKTNINPLKTKNICFI
jgi:hypothetical protein